MVEGDDRLILKLQAEVADLRLKVEQHHRIEQALRESEERHRLLADNATRDIAERRRLMAELEEERARLVQAQEVARVGSWATDLRDLKVTWSEQTHRIFGTDPATFEVTHSEFLKRVHPGDRDAVKAAFEVSMGRQMASSIEHRLVMEDGHIKHVEECWYLIRNARGEPVRAVGTCRDITEAKEARERMSAQLEELRRWQAAMLGREARNLELKREVNALAKRLGEPVPYPSQD